MVPVVHSWKILMVPVVHLDITGWSQLSTYVKNGMVPVVHGTSCPTFVKFILFIFSLMFLMMCDLIQNIHVVNVNVRPLQPNTCLVVPYVKIEDKKEH